MFSGITVPLDGSPLAEGALPYALALGEALAAPVTLVHVVPRSFHALDYQMRYDATDEAASLARAAREMEARAASLDRPGRHVDAYAAAGDAAEEIVRHAERGASPCIVMATHGAGGNIHWAFGSVARRVITAATVPTLVVRAGSTPEMPGVPATIRSILVPLDGSDLSRQAVTLAKTIAQRLGAAVTLARIVPLSTEMYMASPYTPIQMQPDLDEATAAEREAAAADLALIERELRDAGVAATSVVQSGNPADRLLALLADGRYDLVVMSSHGRKGITRWVLGSVAERLVEASHTPVLIVRATPLPPTPAYVSRGITDTQEGMQR